MKRIVIRENKHRSGIHFSPILYNSAMWGEMTWMIPGESDYTLTGNEDQINKIAGVSMGFHHRNSFRLGWHSPLSNAKTDRNFYWLYAYYYNGGKRGCQLLMSASYDKVYSMRYLFNTEENRIVCWIFEGESFNRLIEKHDIPFRFPKLIWGYKLFPYFGGIVPAPKNIKLYLTNKFQ